MYSRSRNHFYAPHGAFYNYGYTPSPTEVPVYCDPRQQYVPSSPYVYARPSEMDALEYEEQQLLYQQAQILAKRRQLAEDRRRYQLQQQVEQERIRQAQAQQEAYHHQLWLAQQHELKQQQAAARQRQIAAYKEAQLEAALREIEYSDAAVADHRRAAHYRQKQPHQSTKQAKALPAIESATPSSSHASSSAPSARSSCSYDPLATLFHAFGLQAPTESCQQKKREATVERQPSAQRTAPAPPKKSSPSPSTSANHSSAASSSNATTTANPKPNITTVLDSLRTRLADLSSRVSQLVGTAFEQLSLGQFVGIDNDLMQVLLALDDVEPSSEEVRTARKQLVSETVSLLGQVDQYKEVYSSASSDASSSTSDNDASPADEPVLASVDISDTSVASAKSHSDDEVEEQDIDADSEGSDVEDEVETPLAAAAATKNDEEEPNASASDASPSSAPAADTAHDVSPLIDFSAPTAKSSDDQGSSPSSVAVEVAEEEKTEVPIANEVAAPTIDSDPFGFNAIFNSAPTTHAVDSAPLADEAPSVPISIGTGGKARVTIESSSPSN